MITPPTTNDKDEDSSDLSGHTFGNDSKEETVENGNGKAKRKKNINEEKQPQYKPKFKRPYPTYEYSNKGKGPLHEVSP